VLLPSRRLTPPAKLFRPSGAGLMKSLDLRNSNDDVQNGSISDRPGSTASFETGIRRSTFASHLAARLRALPRDERGTISIMSVVTIFSLTLVLGMVINAGRQVDEKIRLQNAADAAAYSGGAVMARGLNALAFSNHLEAEVFALVAYMRAGRDAGP